MPEIASAGDREFLLRSIDHTPYRFRVKTTAQPPTANPAAQIVQYFHDNPGQTVNALWQSAPEFTSKSYNEIRSMVVKLVDQGVLERAGRVALEKVDGRYERVASCNVCGAPADKHPIVFYKYNTPVVRCNVCGLLYSNPRWKAEHLFGGYAEEYWDSYASLIAPTAASVAANLARWDPSLSPLDAARQNNRLLDVGCATGEFLDAAKSRGWDAYGLESAPVAGGIAEKKHPGKIFVGTLDNASWPKGYFDAITLWDVIEHLQDPADYVRRIAALLRPGGFFAITTPNIRSVSYKLLGPKWWVVGPNAHIYYFAPRTLARLLENAGFAIHVMSTYVTEVDSWQKWLRPPALKRLAPLLQSASRPITNRFLLGDEIAVFARLKER